MKSSIRTLAVIFSVGLNVAFVGSYVYQMLTRRPTFAYEEMRLDSDQQARMMSSRDRFIGDIDRVGNRIIDLHVGFIDAIAADPPDRTAIQAELDEIRVQQQSMQQLVVEHRYLQQERVYETLHVDVRFYGGGYGASAPSASSAFLRGVCEGAGGSFA